MLENHYRDFYCGKNTSVGQTLYFFEEGLRQMNSAFTPDLRRRFLIKTYPSSFDFEQMLKKTNIGAKNMAAYSFRIYSWFILSAADRRSKN